MLESSSSPVGQAVLEAAGATRGHYLYESGHHGDLWLDLDGLFTDARRMQGWAAALAQEAGRCRPDIVCGPLTGGAFLAQSVAIELGVEFVYAERLVSLRGPVKYRVPNSLRGRLRGRRVLLVEDAINAGSAMLTTLLDLLDCGAVPAGMSALITLGEAAGKIAQRHAAPFFALASLETGLWMPEDCPLCASGERLESRLHA